MEPAEERPRSSTLLLDAGGDDALLPSLDKPSPRSSIKNGNS